jgi:NADH-quinone oxidoreductase subunit L
MLLNRMGDFALLLAIFAIYFIYNSLDYDVVFTLVPLSSDFRLCIAGFQIPAIDFICVLIFIGAMGKSAQLGLHT